MDVSSFGTCRRTPETCMEDHLRKKIEELDVRLKTGPNYDALYSQQIRFLYSFLYPSDGRGCEGMRNRKMMLRLLTEEWRYEFSIVASGLRHGLIRLDSNDVKYINAGALVQSLGDKTVVDTAVSEKLLK